MVGFPTAAPFRRGGGLRVLPECALACGENRASSEAPFPPDKGNTQSKPSVRGAVSSGLKHHGTKMKLCDGDPCLSSVQHGIPAEGDSRSEERCDDDSSAPTPSTTMIPAASCHGGSGDTGHGEALPPTPHATHHRSSQENRDPNSDKCPGSTSDGSNAHGNPFMRSCRLESGPVSEYVQRHPDRMGCICLACHRSICSPFSRCELCSAGRLCLSEPQTVFASR